MKDGVVIRQGRTVATGDGGGNVTCNWCFTMILLPFIAVATMVGCVGHLYKSESFFHDQQVAFAEVRDKVVELPWVSPTTTHALKSANKEIVHFMGPYSANVSDLDFGLSFDHALKLHRYTEYCQWAESQEESCERCTRKDNNGNEEQYDCNCARTYYYMKRWVPSRIFSMGFDQPANHHNPQRDPFPSADIFSHDAKVDPVLLTYPLLRNLRAKQRPVTYSTGGKAFEPGMLTRFWRWLTGKPEMRFEDKKQLESLESSVAFTRDHFVFTNTWEGWFFSAYEEEHWLRIARGFGQFLEGSLLDWQIGDFYDMYNGCTAGDIRSRFYLSDPEEVSVIGELVAGSAGAADAFKLWPHQASNNFDIGIIHGGSYSPHALFSMQTHIAHNQAFWSRFFNLFAGAGAVYMLIHFGLWSPVAGSYRRRIGASIGIGVTLMALTWAVVYGFSDWSGRDSALWTVANGIGGIALMCVSLQFENSPLQHEKSS